MSRTATYHTTVRWTGDHWGHLVMGNGPEMKFSAPPDAHGHAGVFTPEDAFVAAANTCVMMMFIWAAERFKLKLLSYECRTEGTKLIEIDRTEIFTRLRFRPIIRIATGGEPQPALRHGGRPLVVIGWIAQRQRVVLVGAGAALGQAAEAGERAVEGDAGVRERRHNQRRPAARRHVAGAGERPDGFPGRRVHDLKTIDGSTQVPVRR